MIEAVKKLLFDPVRFDAMRDCSSVERICWRASYGVVILCEEWCYGMTSLLFFRMLERNYRSITYDIIPPGEGLQTCNAALHCTGVSGMYASCDKRQR